MGNQISTTYKVPSSAEKKLNVTEQEEPSHQTMHLQANDSTPEPLSDPALA